MVVLYQRGYGGGGDPVDDFGFVGAGMAPVGCPGGDLMGWR